MQYPVPNDLKVSKADITTVTTSKVGAVVAHTEADKAV